MSAASGVSIEYRVARFHMGRWIPGPVESEREHAEAQLRGLVGTGVGADRVIVQRRTVTVGEWEAAE